MKSQTPEQLIATLRARFESHEHRHKGVSWGKVQASLEASPAGRRSLCNDGKAPDSMKENKPKGGALFCDRRYGSVFLDHNGAEAYYAARGFRTQLRD
jgi:hypothetical protein